MGQTAQMKSRVIFTVLFIHFHHILGIVIFPDRLAITANSTLPFVKLGEPDVLSKVRPFVDSLGRERYFHGMNAVVKGPPWHPSIDGFNPATSLSEEDFEIMRDMGFTVIRLGFMWAGFEPTRGAYNATYLKIMKSIAANAAKFGIYTLIDMHQDVFSDRFCGEGVPSWVVKSTGSLRFPEPVDGAYPSGTDGLLRPRALFTIVCVSLLKHQVISITFYFSDGFVDQFNISPVIPLRLHLASVTASLININSIFIL
jgi:hypothetical protein